MRRFLSITLAVALMSASVPALGQTSDEAFQQQVDAALDHYNNRRYAEAAAAFQAAYELRNDPELLYNAARSLERGLQRDEAITMYERFLALPGSTADLRNRATASVQALRAERDAAATPPTPPAGTGGGASGGAGGGGSGGGGGTGAPDDRRRGRDGGSSTLEWVLVGGGGLLIGVGAVFGITALSDNSDFEDEIVPAERRSLADDIDRNALLADIFIGSGIAAAGIGIILLVAGGGEDDEGEEDTAFVPVFLRDGGGLQLRSRF
ncbi:MAG: hypothetical protein IT379_21240 [Deltaproteobacteria bacterium]|nr:hypothetical protein [Deltaproteobacteria bacterium]